QSVDGASVHVMIFATYWSQAGALKQGQPVRLSASGPGYVPTGATVAAKVDIRKNRGAYGSGVSDILLELSNLGDAGKLRVWLSPETIHLLRDCRPVSRVSGPTPVRGATAGPPGTDHSSCMSPRSKLLTP